MGIEGRAALMRLYTDEKAKDTSRGGSGPLYDAIVERAREAKIAGATVIRSGVEISRPTYTDLR